MSRRINMMVYIEGYEEERHMLKILFSRSCEALNKDDEVKASIFVLYGKLLYHRMSRVQLKIKLEVGALHDHWFFSTTIKAVKPSIMTWYSALGLIASIQLQLSPISQSI